MKKVWYFIAAVATLSLFFLGTEYLLYSLLKVQSKLYYPFFALLIFMMAISIAVLNSKKVFHTLINILIVLSSVFVGLFLLNLLRPYIG